MTKKDSEEKHTETSLGNEQEKSSHCNTGEELTIKSLIAQSKGIEPLIIGVFIIVIYCFISVIAYFLSWKFGRL
jgi:hypothetical protein